jgi:hypothetical protein
VTPVARAQTRDAGGVFFGRVQPCPPEKLDSSFSTGQGRGVFFGSVGHCPTHRAGLTNSQISAGMEFSEPGRATKHALRI